jgi:hypothetical protein
MLLVLCALTLRSLVIRSFDFGETIPWFGGVRSLSSPIGPMLKPSWPGLIRAMDTCCDKPRACSRIGPNASGTITPPTVGWSNWNRSVVTATPSRAALG